MAITVFAFFEIQRVFAYRMGSERGF